MTPARVAAAAAAITTALLAQASLIAPASGTVAVSLPAVLVAAVALVDGPATGIAFGFACGLAADLGSDHPAGILALLWLGVGLLAGMFATRHHLLRDALAAAVIAAAAALTGAVLLAMLHSGSGIAGAITSAPLSLLGDLGLALVLVPVVRRMLATHRLRPPRTVATELLAGARHG